jgi:CheY-like chemotaxis protein
MTAPLLLVVDDTPEIALILRRLGRHAGHEVTACGDVAAAWEYLRSTQYPVLSTQYEGFGTPPRRPDLVLVDVNLPGTPGPELCRRVRAAPELTDLPVAVFAHGDRTEDHAVGLAAGADFVVAKDLLTRPDAWSVRIRTLLSWPHGQAARQLLHCTGTTDLAASPERVVQALNPVLRRALPGQALTQLLPVLAERSLAAVAWWGRAAGRGSPPRPRPLEGAPGAWLLPSGAGLDPGRLGRLGPPGAAVVFAVAFVEQTECVVGTAAAPVWAALTGAVPGLAEILAPR